MQLGPTVRDWLDAAMVTGSNRKKHWGSITGFDTLSLTSRCKGPLDTRVNWVFGSPQIVFGPPLGLLVCIQTTLCFWSPAATRADFGSQCAKWEKAQTNRSHHRHGQTAAKKRAHDSSPAISGKATSTMDLEREGLCVFGTSSEPWRCRTRGASGPTVGARSCTCAMRSRRNWMACALAELRRRRAFGLGNLDPTDGGRL